MTHKGKFLAILSCIFIANPSFAQSTIYVKKFAMLPDRQLTLYRETDCENKLTCQVFYQVAKRKRQKVAVLKRLLMVYLM